MSIFKKDSSRFEPIHPAEYYQNSDDCIVCNGAYDFTRLSDGENQTIVEVLRVAGSNKYTPKQRALGLASESSVVKYKARAILNEIVVQKYSESKSPLDALAVGFAYQTKGAIGRQQSIAYFERYLGTASSQIVAEAQRVMFDANDPFFSYKLAELYEQEGLWDSALRYALKSQSTDKNCAPAFPLLVGKIYRRISPAESQAYLQKYMRDERYKPYMLLFQRELDISSEWLENSYTYTPRPYKPSKRALQMEADIKETAHKYITNEKALLLGAEGRNG